MPFTVSHAVVALPFLRTPLVPAAIAIGAMTPDLPLFFHVGIPYEVTHDWVGAIYVDLPLALALLILWRVLVRPVTPVLSPRALRERYPPAFFDGSRAGWRSIWSGGAIGVALLVASLLIGIASHIFWDLFTHPGRWGSVVLPVLGRPWGPLDGTQWLQYGSSAFGLVVLAIWAVRWFRRRAPESRPRFGPWWLAPAFWSIAVFALLLSAIAELVQHGIPDAQGATAAVFRWGTRAGAVILIAGFVAAIVGAIWRSSQSAQADESA